MTALLRFLVTLRTSPRRALLVELGFIGLGALLFGLAVFGMG